MDFCFLTIQTVDMSSYIRENISEVSLRLALANMSEVLDEYTFDELRELPQKVQMSIDLTALD